MRSPGISSSGVSANEYFEKLKMKYKNRGGVKSAMIPAHKSDFNLIKNRK